MDPQEKWKPITAAAGCWLFHAAQSAKPELNRQYQGGRFGGGHEGRVVVVVNNKFQGKRKRVPT